MITTYSDRVESYIKNIQDTIIAAEHNHDIWWIYKSKDTRPKFIDTMNRYSAFFQTSIHAHFVAMIIALYRLYETGHKTISPPQLLRLLDNKHQLSEDARKKVAELMGKAKPIWIKIGCRGTLPIFLNNIRAPQIYNITSSFGKTAFSEYA